MTGWALHVTAACRARMAVKSRGTEAESRHAEHDRRGQGSHAKTLSREGDPDEKPSRLSAFA